MDDPASCTRPARLPALVAGFAAVYLIWGSTFLGIKFAVETLPPFLMAGSRFVLGGAVIFAVLRLRGAPRPTARGWGVALVTGALLLLGGNGLVTWGQQTIPSGRAALIVATTPLWMVLIGFFFYRGARPGPRVLLGLAVGFAGAVLLVKPPGAGGPTGDPWGYLALALSPVAWSAGSLESRRRGASHGLLAASMQMLAGGGLMLLAGSALGEWSLLGSRAVSARSLAAFAYLTAFGALGFTTYLWLLRVASPTAVSTYAYVNPLVAVLLGWLVAGESLGVEVLLPAGLIVGAVILITLPRTLFRSPVPEPARGRESRPCPHPHRPARAAPALRR
jgi:drug/metabolite transporter (DMT)-like permease